MSQVANAAAAGRGRFLRIARFATLALLAGAALEAVLLALRTPQRSALLGLAAFGEAQLGALCLGLLVAAGFEITLRALAAGRRSGLLGPPLAPTRWEKSAAAAWLFGPALLLWQRLLLATFEFKNRELAALAGVGLSAAVGCGAGLAFVSLHAWLVTLTSRRSDAARWSLLPGLLLALGCSLWAAARSGAQQLDARWLLAPLVSAVVALGLLRHARGRAEASIAARSLLLVGAFSVALAAVSHRVDPRALRALGTSGAISTVVLRALRVATDFDGDGYSGWFAGGDCASFDAAIHPGAREVPRDGVDNNCIAGDGGRTLGAAPRPTPAKVPNSVPQRLNFVLITIETLRADHVSFLGSRRDTTPRLRELAQSSCVFEKSYATTPTTRLSLAAMLSGSLPSSLRWLPQATARQMRKLDPETPWLPELLQAGGYVTLAVHANFRAFTQIEQAGFDRGFSHYDTSTPLRYAGGTMQGFPGGAQVDRSLTLLDSNSQRPFFLWLHLLEPHYVYERSPAVPSFGDDELALYDADIAEADRQVGRLLDGLAARGLRDTTMIAVSGDHGEEFGEHGQRWHGTNLYEPQLRTAALLHVPGLPARRVTEAVSFLDFMPTWLHFLRLSGTAPMLTGRVLGSTQTGDERAFFVENFSVDQGERWLLGAVDWPLKLIYTAGSHDMELYDLERDPGERQPIDPNRDETTRTLSELLFRHLENSPGPATAKAP